MFVLKVSKLISHIFCIMIVKIIPNQSLISSLKIMKYVKILVIRFGSQYHQLKKFRKKTQRFRISSPKLNNYHLREVFKKIQLKLVPCYLTVSIVKHMLLKDAIGMVH